MDTTLIIKSFFKALEAESDLESKDFEPCDSPASPVKTDFDSETDSETESDTDSE